MKLITTALLALFTIPLYAQQIKPGTFRRHNKNDEYAQTTTIVLKSNNRFIYDFAGHFMYEHYEGTFSMDTRQVISLSYDSINPGSVNYNDQSMVELAPKKFKYTGNRLYKMDDHGRKIKSARFFSTHRRFLLFGDYTRRRKVFLKRVNE